MAYLVRRSADRIEIRESRSTLKGPRTRQLTRFAGALTPAVLARAAARARRPFDPDALIRRAQVMGIPVDARAPEREAKALLQRLRRGDSIDPVMAGLILSALEGVATAKVPEHVAEVAEWIGASPAARGAALRDLLDAFGRITASKPLQRERRRTPYPHFSSAQKKAAS